MKISFVHIPKNAGTSVLRAGVRCGHYWGEYTHKMPDDIIPNSFTVVRNPYARFVSMFYCNHNGYKGNPYTCDVDCFNRWIRDHIHDYPTQSQYVYDSSKRQKITHILKFENLKNEFEKLMKMWNLDIKLEEHEHKCSYDDTYTVHDINEDTKTCIDTVCSDDFLFFGYSKTLHSV